jgi:hypothetical protein
MTPGGPILHVHVAAASPVGVVLRGGPERWAVVRWDLETGEQEAGGVFPGTLFPRRGAVSPDGTLLAYFGVTRQKGDWSRFFAVSKVPWLTALGAWRWPARGFSAGALFTAEGALVLSGVEAGKPFSGSCPLRYDLGPVTDKTWRSASEEEVRAASVLPLRHPQRRVRAATRAGATLLEVWDGLELTDEDAGLRRYVLGARALDGVQWAGFAPDGAVLCATRAGFLQVRDHDGEILRDDGPVADPGPDRVKSPAWARTW